MTTLLEVNDDCTAVFDIQTGFLYTLEQYEYLLTVRHGDTLLCRIYGFEAIKTFWDDLDSAADSGTDRMDYGLIAWEKQIKAHQKMIELHRNIKKLWEAAKKEFCEAALNDYSNAGFVAQKSHFNEQPYLEWTTKAKTEEYVEAEARTLRIDIYRNPEMVVLDYAVEKFYQQCLENGTELGGMDLENLQELVLN